MEVPAEEGSNKRPRGRLHRVDHFHEEVSPTHFCKVMMARGIEMLPLLDAFRAYLGPVLGKMIVKTDKG
jgi:hypothetical protein